MTDDRQPRTQWSGETMTAPIISREELPTDEVTLADFIYSVRGYGDAVAKAKLLWPMLSVAQSPKQCGESCEFFDMLWKWFEDESRIGADGMRPERHEGLSADDFKTMLDEHEAALSDPSTGLPAPALHAEVRESDLYKLRDLIASHFACEDDCQKYPSGCGCALTAARAVQDRGGK